MARRRSAGEGGHFRSIRRQLVAIAWIPSVILIILGLVVSGLLAYQGKQTLDYGVDRQRLSGSLVDGLNAVERERLLTLRALADPTGDRADLAAARTRTTTVVNEILADWATVLTTAPPQVQRFGAEFKDGGARALLAYRQKIDAGQATPAEADAAYSDLLAAVGRVVDAFGRAAPEPGIVYDQIVAANILTLSDALSRSMALVEVGTRAPGLSEDQYQLFSTLVGTYRGLLASESGRWSPAQRQAAAALTGGVPWQQLQQVEATLLHAQPRDVDGVRRYVVRMELDRATWNTITETLPVQLIENIYVPQSRAVAEESRSQGREQLIRSLAVAVGLVLLGLVVLLLSTRSASRLVQRLRALRDQTLELAEGRLPSIVDRVRRGETVDVDAELPRPAPARDEIGQVAEAFDSAQRTAVTAATREAENRAGTQRVFLNIARRSQVIVHRQLRLLDRAETSQEDPDQLMLLFELDHLATRARRNAENLIILGGAQAGRQWRKPVPLVELVSSAIGESERYARVNTGRFPDLRIDGSAVADLIHLLAELVDNATSFSPPSTRVEVRGIEVGRGVVIEIEDQGLGVAPEVLTELNTMLREPPDFSLMALSQEPRLGLFVVARLAAKHDVLVTLVDSPVYGGTRAVVRIPTALIAPAAGDTGSIEAPPTTEQALPETGPAAEPAAELAAGPARPGYRDAPTTPRGIAIGVPGLEQPDREPVAAPPVAGQPVGEQPVTAREPDGALQPDPDDNRPALPRRVRQANLVPQLLDPTPEDDTDTGLMAGRHTSGASVEATGPVRVSGAEATRSPEDARNRFAGLQRGTRQGRAHQRGDQE